MSGVEHTQIRAEITRGHAGTRVRWLPRLDAQSAPWLGEVLDELDGPCVLEVRALLDPFALARLLCDVCSEHAIWVRGLDAADARVLQSAGLELGPGPVRLRSHRDEVDPGDR